MIQNPLSMIISTEQSKLLLLHYLVVCVFFCFSLFTFNSSDAFKVLPKSKEQKNQNLHVICIYFFKKKEEEEEEKHFRRYEERKHHGNNVNVIDAT